DHLAVYMPIELCHRLAVELRRAVAVLLCRASWDVVGAGKVVIGNGRQVDVAVVSVGRATLVRRLIEWRADVEMRPRYDPFAHAFRMAGLPADGAVSLGIGFVEHHRGIVLPFQISELTGLVSELLQHPHNLFAVNHG